MKRYFSMLVLFLAVAVVIAGVVFSVPASAIDIGGTVWDTGSNGIITFDTQIGSNVTGTYTLDSGELTATLGGQDLKGWWKEAGNVKECGPGGIWSGPIFFRFADDWMSFQGDWGYCDEGISDLDPSDNSWNGTRLITTTTTIETTTTTPADTTTTTIGDCEYDTIPCGDECCWEWQYCCGNNRCCDNEDACCGDTTCCESGICCGDLCCDEYQICCGDLCCGTSRCCAGKCCASDEVCSSSQECVFSISTCFSILIYGEDSEEVELLRTFRDEVLSQSPVGQEIIELYYLWSPAIVKAMEANEAYKEEVKGMIDGVLELINETE